MGCIQPMEPLDLIHRAVALEAFEGEGGGCCMAEADARACVKHLQITSRPWAICWPLTGCVRPVAHQLDSAELSMMGYEDNVCFVPGS